MAEDKLDPLIRTLAGAIDAQAFTQELEGPHIELRRRQAMYRARVGVRIAQACGWRFLPPGEFPIPDPAELDAMCERATENMRDAADGLERS